MPCGPQTLGHSLNGTGIADYKEVPDKVASPERHNVHYLTGRQMIIINMSQLCNRDFKLFEVQFGLGVR